MHTRSTPARRWQRPLIILALILSVGCNSSDKKDKESKLREKGDSCAKPQDCETGLTCSELSFICMTPATMTEEREKAEQAEAEKKEREREENVAAPPTNAETTDSGLASIVLTKGEGTVRPGSTTTVMVHYTGWTTDGKMFDTSSKRGKPAEFRLYAVIPGWTEGLQLMVAGEKRRFWIPAELAYGENPSGGKPAGMLCFDIELLEVK